ncbi:MAG TPA: aspartate/glutamate racemase family protein, partial [Acetobacteraceae bacterium]|nr:aspartate/glutamate racemase family protein [Acetobacteraceae bacterium]
PSVLLINPNSSPATTDMMVGIARHAAQGRLAVHGATAKRSPPMIVTQEALAAAADEVAEIGMTAAAHHAGVIVSAFGDPGLERLRNNVAIPATGICEAAMLAAAQGGRRFGVATVTPDLAEPILARARQLHLAALYTGIRCTTADPLALAGDPQWLREALHTAVADCIERDGAEAVVIGGGPLGQAADWLRPLFKTPIIAPIPCAVERLLTMLALDAWDA